MKYINYLICFIVLYIYIYNPIFVIFGFGLMKVLLLCALLYFIKHPNLFKNYIKQYRFVINISLLMIIYVWTVIFFNNGNAWITPYSILVWLLETFFVPIFLIETIFKRYCDTGVINICINIGFVASIITLIMLAMPDLTNFILGSVIKKPAENSFEYWNRNFGIAEGLSNSYGVVQGIFASFCLYFADKKKWFYYIFFILLSLSTILNARTGFIAIIITIAYKFLFSSVKTKTAFLGIALVLYFLIMMVLDKYAQDYLRVIDHVFSFFTSTSDYITKGETNDYFESLNRFMQMPDSLFGFLFGEGITLFGAENRESSDIAYVNQIFTGGFVFLIMLMAIQFFLYKKIFDMWSEKYIVLLLLFTSLLINFKGIPFCTSESFSRIVMLFYFVLLHNKLFVKQITIFRK